MTDLQTLIHNVRRAGCRVTRQRVLILQALCELDGHASAERVHRRVLDAQPRIHLSTVYRTLERLRDLGILSQIDLGRQCAEYEIVADQPHHHLVCQRCGRVIDLDHSYLAALAEPIRRDFGFDPILCHFAIFGLCRQCRQERDGHTEGEPA